VPTLATLIIREFYEHAAVSRDHTSALACSSRAESQSHLRGVATAVAFEDAIASPARKLD